MTDSLSFHEYEHEQFPVGTLVYILPVLREWYPATRIAGQYGMACKGKVYELLVPFEEQEVFVPVLIGGQVWYVEPAYVVPVTSTEEVC